MLLQFLEGRALSQPHCEPMLTHPLQEQALPELFKAGEASLFQWLTVANVPTRQSCQCQTL